MKIFISWSKDKSKALAGETKKFLQNIFGRDLEVFFSPDMYKGSRVDNEIHNNLLDCDKCLVCLTSDNFTNPWLMYESGVVYGAHYTTSSNDSIVVPILFESIPEWSSWIDKPLNRYAPIQLNNLENESAINNSKIEFERLINQISKEFGINVVDFDANWLLYEENVKLILEKEKLIPSECIPIVHKLLENSDNFILTSPEIAKDKILFHKGFTTHALTKILTDNIKLYDGKYLWFFGRKNHNLISSREYESFFEYLATEGIRKGVDFRCLFVHPKSAAAIKSSSKDRSKIFQNEMYSILRLTFELKNKFSLPVEKLFRLYLEPRTESIIRIDNAVLHRNIIRDSDGYPLPYTNSGFEILSAIKDENKQINKGFDAICKYETIWNNNDKSIPLTEELLKELYGEDF